ncbi:hypothetical protein V5O48_018446, partial [Marasmius crinis-equi]
LVAVHAGITPIATFDHAGGFGRLVEGGKDEFGSEMEDGMPNEQGFVFTSGACFWPRHLPDTEKRRASRLLSPLENVASVVMTGLLTFVSGVCWQREWEYQAEMGIEELTKDSPGFIAKPLPGGWKTRIERYDTHFGGGSPTTAARPSMLSNALEASLKVPVKRNLNKGKGGELVGSTGDSACANRRELSRWKSGIESDEKATGSCWEVYAVQFQGVYERLGTRRTPPQGDRFGSDHSTRNESAAQFRNRRHSALSL